MDLTKSSIKLFTAKLINVFVLYIGLAYFSRELGPEGIGVFFLFQAVLGILTIPAEFGILGAVEKRLSEGQTQDGFITAAIILESIILTVLVAVILVTGQIITELSLRFPLVSKYLLPLSPDSVEGSVSITGLLAAALVIKTFYRLSASVLRGEMRVGETAVIRVVYQVVWASGGTILVFWGFGPLGLIYGVMLGYLSGGVLGWMKRRTHLQRPSKAQLKSLFAYGKYDFISSAGGYIYNWMDIVFIGIFFGQAAVGSYEIAWRLSLIVMLMSQSISISLFPQISHWDSQDVKSQIENIIPTGITYSLVLVIPAFFGTLLLSKDLLRILFGPEFTHAWLVLIILMIDKVTEAGQIIVGMSLQALDRPDLAARAAIIGIVFNLVLNILLVPRFGIEGAAIATTIASLIGGVLLHSYYLSGLIQIRINATEIVWCTVSAAFMAVCMLFILNAVTVHGLFDLLFVVGSAIVIYGVALLGHNSFRRTFTIQVSRIYQHVVE